MGIPNLLNGTERFRNFKFLFHGVFRKIGIYNIRNRSVPFRKLGMSCLYIGSTLIIFVTGKDTPTHYSQFSSSVPF